MLDNSLIKTYAEHFHYNLGMNVTCISNKTNIHNLLDNSLYKSPNHKWHKWKEIKQSNVEFEELNWANAVGVGMVLGWEDYIAIDFDDSLDDSILKIVCEKLNIPNDYEWITETGSGAGFHIILKCNLKNRLELLFNFQNSILKTSQKKFQKESQFFSAFRNFGEDEVHSYYIKKYNGIIGFEGWAEFKENIISAKTNDNRKIFLSDITKKIEFKFGGHLVLPPSFHQSGLEYKFKNKLPRNRPIEIDFINLVQLYKDLCGFEASYSGKINDITSSDVKVQDDSNMIKVMFFETETNGLKDEESSPEMLQIAWYIVNYNFIGEHVGISQHYVQHLDIKSIEKKKCYLVSYDDILLNPDAKNLHNITFPKLKHLGEDLRKIMEEFTNDLKTSNFLVSHNLDFDKNVILNQYEKLKINPKTINNIICYCTMKGEFSFAGKWKKILNENKKADKWKSLEELFYSLYGTTIESKHNAIHDCLLLIACFNKQLSWHRLIKENDYYNSNYFKSLLKREENL